MACWGRSKLEGWRWRKYPLSSDGNRHLLQLVVGLIDRRQPTSSVGLEVSVVSRFLLIWHGSVLPVPGNCPTWRRSHPLLSISAIRYLKRSLPLQPEETQYPATLLSQQCMVEISEEKAVLEVLLVKHQQWSPVIQAQIKCMST